MSDFVLFSTNVCTSLHVKLIEGKQINDIFNHKINKQQHIATVYILYPLA